MNNPIITDPSSLRAAIVPVPGTSQPQPRSQIPLPYTDPPEPPKARTLDTFLKPVGIDEGELIKHRFLCRKGGMLLVGATGLGKSSLAMQLMINWGIGKAAFGLEPARPLKSLLIQAENDDGDLAEMKDGVFNGLNMEPEDQKLASSNILIWQESSKTGENLCCGILEPLLAANKPDLLWLDPALSYIGGDMNSQKDVGKFLRNDLAPLLIKHNCGAIIVHHTNKISKDPDKQMTDVSYLGAGSAEWINWCRAMLALRKTDVDNVYELNAAKRGARLKWRMPDGEGLAFKKYIGHIKKPDTICWMEVAIANVEEMRANNGKTANDVLKHVPKDMLIAKDDLIEACQRSEIGKNNSPKLIKQLLEQGKLFEYSIRRTGIKPKILLGTAKFNLSPDLSLEALTQNSQGNYFPPQEVTKKTL